MATSNIKTPVLLTLSLTFFLLLLNHKVSSKSSLSFSYPSFTPSQPDLIFQGDALVSSAGKLQLTRVKNDLPVSFSLGRTLHTAPVQIWDNATGDAASFVTSFSFVILTPDTSRTADGLAFFLGPVETEPQADGGFLGLFQDSTYNKANKIVAVEFDTYLNEWDPSTRHIGLNVNTIRSTKTALWALANGEVASALITYQASTKLLVASVVYPSRKASFILSASVDLKSVLPEYVRVGFSATTGNTEGYAETHDILSWSFTSTFGDVYSSSTISDALNNLNFKDNHAHLATYVD